MAPGQNIRETTESDAFLLRSTKAIGTRMGYMQLALLHTLPHLHLSTRSVPSRWRTSEWCNSPLEILLLVSAVLPFQTPEVAYG
jgi:hypothetical protein